MQEQSHVTFCCMEAARGFVGSCRPVQDFTEAVCESVSGIARFKPVFSLQNPFVCCSFAYLHTVTHIRLCSLWSLLILVQSGLLVTACLHIVLHGSQSSTFTARSGLLGPCSFSSRGHCTLARVYRHFAGQPADSQRKVRPRHTHFPVSIQQLEMEGAKCSETLQVVYTRHSLFDEPTPGFHCKQG